MLDDLFKWLGIKTYESDNKHVGESIIKSLEERTREYNEVGKKAADDCFNEALDKGNFARLSTIDRKFKQQYPSEYKYVYAGFQSRMRELCAANLVTTIQLEQDDVAFFHMRDKDRAHKMLSGRR